jgi:hypothetical protein
VAASAVAPNHIQRSACKCGPPPEDCVPDNEDLTQYGPKAGKFRNQPREGVELGLSVLIGRWSAGDAVRYVLPQPPAKEQLDRAVVRLTTAGTLRKAGFAVVHTPGRVKPGKHATVVWSQGDPIAQPVVPWSQTASEEFDSCFNKEGEGEHDEP